MSLVSTIAPTANLSLDSSDDLSDTSTVVAAQNKIAMMSDDEEPAVDANVAVQEDGQALDAVEAALQDAGINDLAEAGEIAVIEIPAPIDGDSEASMFVVLWGNAVHSLTWIDALPVGAAPELPDQIIADTGLRPEVMAGVLTAGNMAFGTPESDPQFPHYSLMRWIAVANPTRAAWDALDRFFLGTPKKL